MAMIPSIAGKWIVVDYKMIILLEFDKETLKDLSDNELRSVHSLITIGKAVLYAYTESTIAGQGTWTSSE